MLLSATQQCMMSAAALLQHCDGPQCMARNESLGTDCMVDCKSSSQMPSTDCHQIQPQCSEYGQKPARTEGFRSNPFLTGGVSQTRQF
jgi:hypothetical protein